MNKTERAEDAPEITPQVLHLRDLLKWVRQGRIRVPNFQRDFTWDRSRMLNLFDSIRKQYPIGTLLFWESSKARPMLNHLGPLQLPDFQAGKLLVLDGQQRLTTLAGVLLLDELPRSSADDRDPSRWQVWYDAATNDFTYFDVDRAPLSAVKVSELMGTKGLYSAAQRIMSESNATPDVSIRENWVERIETVSSALAAYRIPLVIFATESLRLAVESFTRLNRSGQSMGADEMFSALTYAADDDKESFRLSTHIDSILAEISRAGFGVVDRVVVLRVVLLAASLDPFRTEWDQLAKDTQKDATARLPAAIVEARRGLLGAVQFLRQEGVPNGRLLPYAMQLVGLAAFFGQRSDPPTEAQKRLLSRWLWVSAFTEGFGGLNPSRILVQLKYLREVIPTQSNPIGIEGIDLDAPAHPFPERHDHRSARVRALLCVMLREPAARPDGSFPTTEEMAIDVLERGPEAMIRVCSRVLDRGSPPLQSSPANRVFDVALGKRGQAKNWLLSVDPAKQATILPSHFISAPAWKALVDGDHRLFVEERIKTLMALERTFMAEKGVTPPKSDQTAPSAIDVEDQVPLSEGTEIDDEDIDAFAGSALNRIVGNSTNEKYYEEMIDNALRDTGEEYKRHVRGVSGDTKLDIDFLVEFEDSRVIGIAAAYSDEIYLRRDRIAYIADCMSVIGRADNLSNAVLVTNAEIRDSDRDLLTSSTTPIDVIDKTVSPDGLLSRIDQYLRSVK